MKLDYKAHEELVTSADLKVDAYLREEILNTFAHHQIISEESSPNDQEEWTLEQPVWIIDPIDGTVNYAHHHFQVAISIAFAIGGEVQVGVVHCPFQHETFHAVKGEGGFLNGDAIQVSQKKHLKDALLATGFPYHRENVEENLARLKAVLLHARDIRRIGSAAIDLCWVAMGRLDGYYESVSVWDMAAGAFIATEAGATLSHLYSVPDHIPPEVYTKNLIVTNPHIHQSLKNVLLSADQG